jgi:superoxide dismutase, Cu-Zn family
MNRSIAPIPAAVCVAAAGLFAASPAIAGADHASSTAPLTVYSDAIPAGATAQVKATYNAAGSTIVTLHVKGLKPHTAYGAHAHVNRCGLQPADAGGHFQFTVDPVQPSVDPAYANPRNEIWLDLTTNGAGNGTATTKVAWQFSPTRAAKSVVIHQQHTSTAPGSAGTAGPRLACVDVDF